MNFFQRRRILKKTNFLDLHPVRLLDHNEREDGVVEILLPRFKNKLSSNLFRPRHKEPFIRIRLDRAGSLTWLLIDGTSAVAEICEKLSVQLTAVNLDAGDTEERAAQFFSLLYRERYITFTELEDKHEANAK